MDNKMNYMRIFKIAGVDLALAYKLCDELSEQTLNRLTRVGFHRSLIKPILEKALFDEGQITDTKINEIMNDQDLIIAMMQRYCK